MYSITMVGMVEKDATYYLLRSFHKLLLRKSLSFKQLSQAVKITGIVKKGNRARLKNEKTFKITIPPVCIFSVSGDCNLKCKGCYASNDSNEKELSAEEIDKVLTEAISLGIYIFIIAGGEPLMKEKILSLLSKHQKAIFLIFTNGLLINGEAIQIFQKNRHLIPVLSFEGSNYFNDLRRGKGSGPLIKKTIETLQKSKLVYGFSTLAFRNNVEYITSESYLRKMESYGMKFGFIIDYVPTGKTIEHSMIMSDADLSRKKERINKSRKNSNMALFNLPSDEKLFGTCGAAGKLLIHINAQGEVEPCVFCNESVDNINEKSLIEILNSEFFRETRKKLNESPFEGKCRLTCDKINVLR